MPLTNYELKAAERTLATLQETFSNSARDCRNEEAKPLFIQMRDAFNQVVATAHEKRPNALDDLPTLHAELGKVTAPMKEINKLVSGKNDPVSFGAWEDVHKSVGWFGEDVVTAIQTVRKFSR
jgi:hypothetical protein